MYKPILGGTVAIIIGYSIYNYMYHLNSTKPKKKVEKEEDKYLKEFTDTSVDDFPDLNALKKCYITEDTQHGEIKMNYNDGYFYYYSSRKEIPYPFLDMVARKYVLTYKCKSLFKSMDLEPVTDASNACAAPAICGDADGGVADCSLNIVKTFSLFDKFMNPPKKDEPKKKKPKKAIHIKTTINHFKYGGKNIETSKNKSVDVEPISFSQWHT